MNTHTAIVHVVKAVPCNMVVSIYNIDFMASIRELPGMYRTAKTSPDDENLNHSTVLLDMR